jgi:nucleotide-binding universal stress UspA family protein
LAEESVLLIEATGVEAVSLTKEGSPHREIVETAQSTDASLIVLGSRGLTGLRALGGVGERVAHHAPCSVLIVRRLAHPIADADRE